MEARIPSIFSRMGDAISGKRHIQAEVDLQGLKNLLEQDKRALSRHPILKHLVARYEAFLKKEGPVEPVTLFRDRMNELTVQTLAKKDVKFKKQQRRSNSKARELHAKEAGKKRFNKGTPRNHGSRSSDRY